MNFLKSVMALCIFAASAQAGVIHVNANLTPPSPDGASWANAFPTIQQGIQAALNGGGGEVWVAAGTYTGSAGNPLDSDGVAAGDTTIILPEGVHLFGGFAGNEAEREARNWTANPTLIDGENVRRGVYTAAIPGGKATLDGFIIRRGHATEYGGGLYNDQSAPIIANCRFENNHAGLKGGGAFNYRAPLQRDKGFPLTSKYAASRFEWLTYHPAFEGVTFHANTAGFAGGGLYLDSDFTYIENCKFTSNSAGVGGGVYDQGGYTELFRSTFQNNTATDAGAGYCYEGTYTTEFTNCLLNDNNSGTMGGGIYHDGYRVSLTHTTVAKNGAPQGGGVFGGQAFSLVLNSIAYDNGATNIEDASDSPFTMLASCLEFEPADPAQGVFNVNPLFINPALKNYALTGVSPCLDAGDYDWAKVTEDINGAARPQGPEVDMGAIEGDPLDIDNDGLLDQWELDHFGSLSRTGTGDEDGDGLTNAREYELSTDPNDTDSDNDGYSDKAEADAGRNPNNPADYPGRVVFADPRLEIIVRGAVNRPTGPLMVSHVVGKGFTQLTATNKSISDLRGIEYCTDLSFVNLSGNLISDVAPLAELPSLTWLFLNTNPLSDLTPLASNSSIKNLYLENNSISDLTPLGSMNQLVELWLTNNDISNIAPLAGLQNLVNLYLARNLIMDISPLSGMTSLKTLFVRENSISTISVLAGLPNIVYFSAEYNDVQTIPAGLNLPFLSKLHLGGNEIADCAPIAAFTGLTELTLWRNNIADLSPVANLVNLKVLSAETNQIVDITPVANLTNLEMLRLSSNRITDASPIAGLSKLTTLWIEGNQIADISMFGGLTKIHTLLATGNRVVDISPLAAMPQLANLLMASNRIVDITPLANLVNLSYINLEYNRIMSVEPLAGLPKIGILQLRGNRIGDVAALVQNSGLGAGDSITLEQTPLSQVALCSQVPTLIGRGASVTVTGTCGADSDGDDLADVYENAIGTNPNLPDTDGDGANDAIEVREGSDPRDANDLPPSAIQFPDPGLDAAIRLAIGKPTGALFVTDLVGQGFNFLDASNMAVSDLSGLEFCTDLVALILDYNAIIDLTPLTGLTNLQQLSARENLIESVEPLADLVQLGFLDIGGNRISSLDGLAALPGLYFLVANDNELVDISPLANIPGMNFLYLGENDIQSIAALEGLNLYALSLYRATVDDIGVLSGMHNLQQLDLTGTEVSTIAPLAGLPNLFGVYMGHTNVGDLSPLASLPLLRILEIDGLTGLDNFDSLSTMTGIEELYADHLGIADIEPLANLTGLKVLYLRNNRISDVSPLVQLPVLRSLYLEHNQVTDYSGLAAIPTLRTLELAENGLTDIQDLAQFTQLSLVYLSGNQISDASSLAAIPGLRELDLSSNGFTNFASLPPLTGDNPLLLLGDNGISDLAPLLTHLASSPGVHIELGRNPLPRAAFCTHLPALEALGHQVYFDLDWREEQFVPFAQRALACNNPNGNPDGDDATTLVEINRGTDPTISGLGERIEFADPYLELFAFVALDKYLGFLYADEVETITSLSVRDAHIFDLTGVEHLTGIQFLDLSGNDIVELDKLIANPGLGSGDTLLLEGNPLSQQALCVDLPVLIARGVNVGPTSGVCDGDPDEDGLLDSEEATLGTDPENPDTDNDGLNDGDEVARGTNPLETDSDNDGIPDGTEVGTGTDPLDGASVPSDVYVDVASGNDDTGVGTQAAPWATVAHAVATVEGSATNTVSIHIAEGVYTELNAAGGALILDSHEHLFGGYEAAGWTRDARNNVTVLDASVADNGTPAGNVVILDAIVNARLDGLTVTGAFADPEDYTTQDTAGVFVNGVDSSTTIANCQIIGNRVNGYGSGGMLLHNSSPTVTGCNIAVNFSEGLGGGIGIRGLSLPMIENSAIGGNEGRGGGGGIVIDQNANAVITNCVINGNQAGNQMGGGIFFFGGTATVSNCTIANNDADTRSGGGIAVMSATVRLINTIFAENRHHAIADFTDGSGLVLENCLFDGNPEGDYYGFSVEDPLYYDGADSLNSLLPQASGNVDGAVQFSMSPGGTWTSLPTYNVVTDRTLFTNSAANLVPGGLRGRFIALTPDAMFQALVLDNSATALEVQGDFSDWFVIGDAYHIVDYHLAPGSAAIDMGIDTSAPEDGGVTTDLDGIARGFDGDSLGAATADGSDYDIGAYESDTPAIVDAITVLSPNGGELITRGTLQAITWSSTGNVGANVKIVARKGASSATIVASTPNDGNYAWLVPATYPLGNNFVVEVSSVSAPTILDTSDAFFTVQASAPPTGTITVVSPNGGETFQRGATYPITWSSTGDIGTSVKILVRRATSSAVVVSSTANDGHFAWTVPTYPVGSGYTVEISSVLAPAILDSSNAGFSLSDSAPPAGTIIVTAPNGGETYVQGTTMPITWTSTGTTGSDVQILARSASQTFTVAPSTPNDGSFNWAIPAGQVAGTDYTLEVRSLSLPAIGDLSDGAFTIGSAPPVSAITVISPNGGETLVRGSLVEIRWSSTGDIGANVRIIARRGTSSGTISPSTPNDGSFAWTVPTNYPTGTGFTLEIASVTTPAILDITDAAFSIAATAPTGGTISVLSPNGGESFLAGTTAPITWSSTGDTGSQVQILAHGAGQTFTLAATTDNDGNFDWAIPAGQAPGADYTVEVRSLAFPAVGDSSNAAFTIGDTPPTGSITVLSPNGGESIARGATVEITWSSTGTIGSNVMIIARKGSTSKVIATTTPNDGSYTWVLPTNYPLGAGMTIEISSVTAPSILDTCDTTFTVAP